MRRLIHSKVGFGALLAYAALLVTTAIGLYALGAGTDVLSSPFRDASDQARFGKLRVRADDEGRCREFSVDNRTYRIVESGLVVCSRERARERPRNKADSFREAFGGQ